MNAGWRTHFACFLGVGRTSLYTIPVRRILRDRTAMAELALAHEQHPLYGAYRLALHLGWNIKKASRIRRLTGIVIPHANRKHRTHGSRKPEITAPPNILKRYAVYRNVARPQDGRDYSGMASAHTWVQDFTYL